MSKTVYAKFSAHITPEVHINEGDPWDADHPVVKAKPWCFTDPEPDAAPEPVVEPEPVAEAVPELASQVDEVGSSVAETDASETEMTLSEAAQAISQATVKKTGSRKPRSKGI